MRLLVALVGALLCFPALVQAADEPADPCKALVADTQPTLPPDAKGKKAKPKKGDNSNNLVPLSLAICEVQRALDAYQDDPTVKRGELPKLLTADFDFKTVLDTKASVGISILVFKFGVSYDKQTTNDVDFQYEPKSRQKRTEAAVLPKNFQQELIDTIKAAAKAKEEQEKVKKTSKDPLVFKQLSVTLGYGVTWDVNVGASIPISIVTLGPGLDHSKNSVQTVKLVFADKTEAVER
jgi:hypothetical protein